MIGAARPVMQAAITAAARYGGDTDTLGAITGALAGALHGIEWMPADWSPPPSLPPPSSIPPHPIAVQVEGWAHVIATRLACSAVVRRRCRRPRCAENRYRGLLLNMVLARA